MGDSRQPLRHFLIPCLPVAPASSKPVPEPDHVTPAAPASSREHPSSLQRPGALGLSLVLTARTSSGSRQLVGRGPPINSCGRRRASKPTKASRSPSAEGPRPVDVAASCGARWECGSVAAGDMPGKLGGPQQSLPRACLLARQARPAQDWNADVSGKKKVWGSVRMGPVDVSLTSDWSKIYPSCRPAARRDANTTQPRSLILSTDERALVPRPCQTTSTSTTAPVVCCG